jgi:DNA gyrase subunit A
MEDETISKNNEDRYIIHREIEEDMKVSYLNYAMSSIVGRALPDVRDGLKPVHRRILYAMHDMGIVHNKSYKKSARIVGEVLGKYHPHGDTAVYDSMVRMVQNFALRYPLIQGQGNFGSIDGDNAAAMRYTEARMNKIGEEILKDIEKKTVNFKDNFDGSLKEPIVLPSRIPNLLINGSTGIAVGMATNIPPHNINEICNAAIEIIKKPDIEPNELMKIIKGPDFPTGGIIMGMSGIKNAYHYGRGKIKVRARTNFEISNKKKAIIITEIPFQVNKSILLEQIANLVKEKKVQGIDDLRDESDKRGMRIVIELKKDSNEEVILNQLIKYTNLQVTFGIINLAIVNNEPKVLSIKAMLNYFIKHRKEVITRKTKYELDKAEEKCHILEGLIIALQNIDEAITLIKKANSANEAKEKLIEKYGLSEKQSVAILDMKLQRLTSLEQDKIKNEHKSLLELISELKSILNSEERIFKIITSDLEDIIEKYGNERKTDIIESYDENDDIEIEDLIEKEEMIITITNSGYIKRVTLDTYKQQKRGGRGIIATGKKADDEVNDLFVANTHNYLLFFTDKGIVQWKKVYQIPEASRQAKGNAIINLLEMDKDTKVSSYIPISKFDDKHYLVMITKNGLIKKTNLAAYSKPRKGGIIAINLTDNDELIDVLLTDGNKNILIATAKGMAVKFDERDVRAVGRNSIGVRGIKLKNNDNVIGAVIAPDNMSLLTITENGYGKRTKIADYRLINRGGSGVINIITNERNGNVVSIKAVEDEHDLLFISKNGIAIRTSAQGISVIGRNTQGMRLMKLSESDKVVAATKIISEKEEEQVIVEGELEKKEKLKEIGDKIIKEDTELIKDMDFINKDEE